MSDIVVQHKYLMLASSTLDRFKAVRQGVWKCRCPYCGDSTTSKKKARGYFFTEDGSVWFKCHNCGIATSLQGFLRDIVPLLYRDYIVEVFGNRTKEAPDMTMDITETHKRLSNPLLGVDKANPYNAAGRYLLNRAIPEDLLTEFLHIPSLVEFAHRFERYKDRELKQLACCGIPFIADDVVTHVQCRVIEPVDKMRYMTFELNSGPKLFGYNRADTSKLISVLEGPFDSVFVHNAVATAGAADHANVKFLQNEGCNLRFIMDSDYRTNKHVRKILDKYIQAGHKVVIYDSKFRHKDINDAILAGDFTIDSLNQYLDERTFQGTRARLELSRIAR